MTTIMQALLENNFSLAEKLILEGHTVHDSYHGSGLSILHMATLKQQERIVQLLLETGFDANVCTNEDKEFDEYLVHDSEQIITELYALGNKTPLHIAAKEGLFNIAKLLLIHGANANNIDAGKCTPLHWAAAKGDLNMVKLLLENSADVDSKDMANSTPIHEASKNGHSLIVAILMRYRADVSIIDIAGCTARDLAAPHTGILNMLTNSVDNSQFMH